MTIANAIACQSTSSEGVFAQQVVSTCGGGTSTRCAASAGRKTGCPPSISSIATFERPSNCNGQERAIEDELKPELAKRRSDERRRVLRSSEVDRCRGVRYLFSRGRCSG